MDTAPQAADSAEQETELARERRRWQVMIGAAVLGLAGLLAWGARSIPAQSGYSGVGPNFLPWVVAAALALCGLMLLREALSGGWRAMDEPSGAARGDWPALAWVVVGLLANAALLSRVGFVLSCALCFILAVRGLRQAEGTSGRGLVGVLRDALTGLAISAPTFWLFTKGLGLNLPGLTTTGWL